MVDASHARERNHGPVARWLDGTRHGCVAVQRHVRAILVVVARVLPDQVQQVPLAEHDHVVKHLAP
jgi:hypothetical protein